MIKDDCIPRFGSVWSAFLSIVTAISITGCEPGHPYEVHPVAGRVLFRGEPCEGAEICLYPVDGVLGDDAPYPRGFADHSGYFNISSYQPEDGAPAGEYHVSIVWRQSESDDPEIRDSAPDRLRGKYASPESSGLTIRVDPGVNELEPFDL